MKTTIERFEEKFKRGSKKECWTWNATITGWGYGYFFDGTKTTTAHRFAYRIYKGPIPRGLQIDHLCRNRACVNPAHLEAVTQRENILRGVGMGARNARKTHCSKGHELIGKNIYRGKKKNRRDCVLCRREHDKKRYWSTPSRWYANGKGRK